MRLIWQSNAPFNTSAYAKQTLLFLPRIIAAGYEIAAISAPYSFGGVLNWDGIPMVGASRDTAGCDTIIPNHEYFGADWTIVLADPFGLLKAAKELSQIRLAALFPVDCNPLGEGDVTFLRDSQAVPVAVSRFGERVLRAEGADPLYAPHGVDTDLYFPGDPGPFRDTIPGASESTFIAGVVAMNRDLQRKSFAEIMLAFSRFHARHPDSILALHTSPVNNPGLNLSGLAARLGIGASVNWPDAYSYDLGLITEEQMVAFYRGIDVLVFPSYGEGFGLPAVESQACGTPVILNDASAQSELCGSGWLVDGSPWWSPGHGAWWRRPDPADIEQALEQAWQAREDGRMPGLGASARAFALNYDIDRVFEQFMVPVLKELEARIS